MSGELRLSAFRYSQTPDDDFVIGSPYTSALKTSKYLVFQTNTAVGYGSNPHLRCQWIPELSSWRLRFSHDGTQINDFALSNTNNNFVGINTFTGPVTFNNDVQFNHDVVFGESSTVTAPTRPTSDYYLPLDTGKYVANTDYVKHIIDTITVNNAAQTSVVDNTTLGSTVYPTWVQWSSSDEDGKFAHSVSSTKLSFNPLSGVLSATQFTGSGAGLTSIPAGQLTGTFSNVSFNLGTTSVDLNAPVAEIGLTGITSLTGSTLSLGTTTATTVSLGTGPVSNTTNVDGTTLNLGNTKATAINLGTASTTQTINIGTGSGVTTINIGAPGDIVAIAGDATRVNAVNLEITDKTITLNNNGLATSGEAAGIEIEEGGLVKGSIKVANSRNSWDLIAPNKPGTLRFTTSVANFITNIISTATGDNDITLPDRDCTLDFVGHTQGSSTISDSTDLGRSLITFSNPTPTTTKFIRINTDNTVTALDAASFRTAIGAGTSSTVGTVTSVTGSGSVSGLTLSGTVTTSGSLTLSGNLVVDASNFPSKAANTFLAAPNGSAGTPVFRTIAPADIPSLDASKITTGTLSTSIMPVVPRASRLDNTVTVASTGDVLWSVSFNGSEGTLVSSLASIANTTVTEKTLTNYTLGSNTAITGTDTILQAFGKTQRQINDHTHSTLSGSLTIGDLTLTGNEYLIGSDKGINIGNPVADNTPYIEFNSSGLGSAYDCRIESTNGSSTNGQGDLNITANNVSTTGILSVLGNGLNIGNPNVAVECFLDFHSNGLGNEFDARIFSTNTGIASDGTANLVLQANEIYLGTSGTTEVRFGGATAGFIEGSNTGNIRIAGSSTGTGQKHIDLISGYGNSGMSLVDNLVEITAGNGLVVNGNIVSTGNITAYQSASDFRLKKDIKEIENAVDKVKQLKGITFKFNDTANELAGLDTEESQVGIIAQDLEAIFPELTPLAPFNKDGSDYKMVKYDKIVALLIQAVKEQQVQIDELKSKLNLN